MANNNKLSIFMLGLAAIFLCAIGPLICKRFAVNLWRLPPDFFALTVIAFALGTSAVVISAIFVSTKAFARTSIATPSTVFQGLALGIVYGATVSLCASRIINTTFLRDIPAELVFRNQVRF